MAKQNKKKKRDRRKKKVQRPRAAKPIDNRRPIRVMIGGAICVALFMLFFMFRFDGETLWERIQGPAEGSSTESTC